MGCMKLVMMFRWFTFMPYNKDRRLSSHIYFIAIERHHEVATWNYGDAADCRQLPNCIAYYININKAS